MLRIPPAGRAGQPRRLTSWVSVICTRTLLSMWCTSSLSACTCSCTPRRHRSAPGLSASTTSSVAVRGVCRARAIPGGGSWDRPGGPRLPPVVENGVPPASTDPQRGLHARRSWVARSPLPSGSSSRWRWRSQHVAAAPRPRPAARPPAGTTPRRPPVGRGDEHAVGIGTRRVEHYAQHLVVGVRQQLGGTTGHRSPRHLPDAVRHEGVLAAAGAAKDDPCVRAKRPGACGCCLH